MYVLCSTCLTDAWVSFHPWQAAESMLRHAREARAVALPRAVCAALRARRLRKATWLTSATRGFAFFLLLLVLFLKKRFNQPYHQSNRQQQIAHKSLCFKARHGTGAEGLPKPPRTGEARSHATECAAKDGDASERHGAVAWRSRRKF